MGSATPKVGFRRFYRHGHHHNQFGLSVNFPDNQTGYDGVHDDKDRAELNLE